MEKGIDSIRLRGHHILCLLGFRGRGYSPEFVRNMARVARGLRATPQLQIEIEVGTDVLCQPCPHLGPRGCVQRGSASEEEVKERDLRALEALKLVPRQTLPWSQALDRVGRFLDGESLAEVCQGCRWLPLGYCHEGVAALHRGFETIKLGGKEP